MVIREILNQPEGKTLEFKRDLSSPRRALYSLVAFANSAGGRLVIGVEDTSRTVVGVEHPLDEERRVANLIADSIQPRLLPEIEIVPWRKLHVLVVQVYPSPLRPHYIKADGPGKGTYVRLGSTNRLADAPLIAELRRRIDLESYDEQPLPKLDFEMIDFAAASQCFSQYRSLRPQDLRTLGLVADHDGRTVPTIGGMMLFGKDRLRHVPDAWIRAAYFASTDKTQLKDQAEFRDYPIIALQQAINFVERNTRMGADIGSVRRVDVPGIPPVALREALVNAVTHADYSLHGGPIKIAVFEDRVEFENPGILLPGLTVEELGEGISRIRNRVVARSFKELRVIEQWGSGIQKIMAACFSAGLPPPEFVEIGLCFRVIIRTEKLRPETIADSLELRLLDYLRSSGGRSTAEIAAHIGLTRRATQGRMAKLYELGLVVIVGLGPRDPHRKWSVATSEGRKTK